MEVGSYESVTVYLELRVCFILRPMRGCLCHQGVCITTDCQRGSRGCNIRDRRGDYYQVLDKGVEMTDDGTHGYEYGSGLVVV